MPDVSFDRVTYELTPSVRFPFGVPAGICVVPQSNVKFYADGLGPDLKFKDATGANLELGWRSRSYRFVDGGVALVYTSIKYRDELDNHYNGNSVGIRFTANFGWTVFGRDRLACGKRRRKSFWLHRNRAVKSLLAFLGAMGDSWPVDVIRSQAATALYNRPRHNTGALSFLKRIFR